ncbi:helix-turn-helix domain-containing protein [Methylopila turkensis]|nr:AraC family transcriptional regulator [Methylopila turkensis]
MYRRVHEPEASDRRSAVWPGGRFDAGRRALTRSVEGVTRSADLILLVTLRGGARRLEVRSDCGHRYDGTDFAGAVSLAPPDCERRIRLQDVEAEWASVALAPSVFEGRPPVFAPFSNADDPFVRALVCELDRAQQSAGVLDPAYGETLAYALGRYMASRYAAAPAQAASRLAPWRLKRVTAFVEAHLHRPLAIAELAAIAEMSSGHFHRVFRETTGVSPLGFVTERRIARAEALLRGGADVVEAAAAVGFASPSHFARLFRRITGRPPSAARRT